MRLSILTHGSNKDCPNVQSGEWTHCIGHALESVDDFETRIADALGTGERGEALIEVARNAHRAEQELAAAVARLKAFDERTAYRR